MSNITSYKLKKHSYTNAPSQKILVVVMDGIGLIDLNTSLSTALLNTQEQASLSSFYQGNAVNASYMPHLFSLIAKHPFCTLKAHGTAVGLPSNEDMGNSEVGHNALGAGRIFAQGAKLVQDAIDSQALFKGETWKWLVEHNGIQKGENTLHMIGLFSDGNVHSHINHLFSLIEGAQKSGVKKVRLHLLLDGRDVPPRSALEYIEKLDLFLEKTNQNGFECLVASGGGRMKLTMDRYEAEWNMVEKGYHTHVLGEDESFSSFKEAVSTLREKLNLDDQNLPGFVITQNKKPVGTMEDHDAVILFNFRGDRAIEISQALTQENFDKFPRKRFPKVRYAGMMQYDGDLKIPERFLVTPPCIQLTMGELLAQEGVKQFACSETQKYGHVTYFWNGNKSGYFNEKLETYIEVLSDTTPFVDRPWMKAVEVTEKTIEAMEKDTFQVGRINFPNGDMVGHTGSFGAASLACATVDQQLARLMEAAQKTNTILIITADHGNADQMFEINKKTKQADKNPDGTYKAKTSHTLSPVPFIIYNAPSEDFELKKDIQEPGLANVASTVLELAGFEAPSFYEPSLLQWKKKI